MRNPKYALAAGGAFLALTAVLTTGSPRTATGQNGKGGPDVRVINTPQEPLPVALQGSAKLDTTNPIPVSVQGPVQVGAQNPLPVRDVDNPGLNPFHGAVTVEVHDGEDSGFAVIATSPAGKRLVIDHVSALADLGAGQAPIVSMLIEQTGIEPSHYIAFAQHIEATGQFIASQPIDFAVGPGQQAHVVFVRRGGVSGGASCSVLVTGHLVSL